MPQDDKTEAARPEQTDVVDLGEGLLVYFDPADETQVEFIIRLVGARRRTGSHRPRKQPYTGSRLRARKQGPRTNLEVKKMVVHRGEKEIWAPKIPDDRQVVRATAASLRRALALRSALISFGLPDTAFDGHFIETKLGSDFLKEHQLRNFAWALRWRGQHIGIETAPSRASQMNPKEFGGLRRFPDVESYLLDLEGSSTWEPRDGWGLVSMWRELCRLIPENAGEKIRYNYPDLRIIPKQIAADTPAEEVPAAEPTASETPAPPSEPAPVITPPRADLAIEAVRFLNTGRRTP